MASDVDICNLALSHLGDSATVATLTPPDGSAQADHCARFYPICRNALLEMHSWGFATTRVQLALLSTNATGWTYTYAVPGDAINLLAVLDASAVDDYSESIQPTTSWIETPLPLVGWGGQYSPQPFQLETNQAGAAIILTNQVNAVLRYTRVITDPTRFSWLFVRALSWLLAVDLAGPILKGDAGAAAALRCMGMVKALVSEAKVSDSSDRSIKPRQSVPWMARR